MVRRRAIDDVGGVATETVTEDLHTSLRLHRRGWRLVYHNKVVALGIAPDDYDGFILQRLRWAQGAMQVIRREGFLRGLTIPQRLNYIASTGTYFDAYRKAIMFLVIPVMIVTDTLPVDAPGAIFLMAWGVQFLASQVALKSVSRGNYRLLWTEVFDTMKMFAFINASVALFSRKPIAFKVTPKGQSGDRRLHPFLYPFIGLVGLYLASIIFGVLRVIPPGVGTANTPAIVAGTIWAFLVAVVLVVVAAYGYAQVSRRRLFRVPVSVLVRYECGPESGTASVVDMTLLGCALTMPKVLPRGAEVKLWFTGATAPIIAKVVVSRPAAGGVGLVQASFAVEAGVSSLAPVVVSALWQHWRPGEFAPQQGTAMRLAA
jgi:cellulose synthase (UDP-forming)